jgi:hypothetical protein
MDARHKAGHDVVRSVQAATALRSGPTMSDKPWIFRTYAGHSIAVESNALYRKIWPGGGVQKPHPCSGSFDECGNHPSTSIFERRDRDSTCAAGLLDCDDHTHWPDGISILAGFFLRHPAMGRTSAETPTRPFHNPCCRLLFGLADFRSTSRHLAGRRRHTGPTIGFGAVALVSHQTRRSSQLR